MKILFVDHPEADMLAAGLYMGLRQQLGSDDDVVDWPYKRSYHGQNDDSYTQPNGKPGFTAPFPWLPASTGRPWSQDEVASRIGEFDLVILASPRQNNNAALSHLISRVGRAAIRRLVIVDGEDYSHVRWDSIERFQASVYFKREMIPNAEEHHPSERGRVEHLVRVVPFPFGSSVPPDRPAVQKDLGIVFIGGGNYPGGRGPLEAALRQIGPDYIDVGMLPHGLYLDTISRAKIAVATRGWGWDALRLWEVPSCPGTLLLRDRTPLLCPQPLVDGVHCAYFDGPHDIADVARGYLSDEPHRAEVAARGNQMIRDHHTVKARARQLLEEAFR